MLDFVAIDFENANNARSSACSLGITIVKDGKIQETKYWLIKPYPFEMGFFQQRVHKIELATLENELTFDELWSEIRPYLENQTILAHNASYDLNLLRGLVDHYGLTIGNLQYACTVDMAKVTWPNEPKHSLGYLAYYNQIKFVHHRADDDARVCAMLALRMAELHQAEDLDDLIYKTKISKRNLDGSFARLTPRPRRKAKSATVIPNLYQIPSPDHHLFGKLVVFTGDLETFSREEAQHLVIQKGGVAAKNISPQTHYVVVGKQNALLVGEDLKSTKMRRAEEFINRGFPLVVLTEEEFLTLIQ
ncbi:hypothetical protein BWI96_00655 [Siphonobacter sp. SORGH_AS_0500]|uniref:exonuclease domain-containing protein n=1 Tax=Siphonobacter sp. SORGH_AS_0500 TaxID=1864824 RepID=UPI000CA90A9D|nr:exonuclease domain-containing protein [Siphonobacter sp. SORGH_AS_0500]PKK38332.1 hypothetical protein BWI96_00655 [Siphonobacter sp. SORGH_AS_0500]